MQLSSIFLSIFLAVSSLSTFGQTNLPTKPTKNQPQPSQVSAYINKDLINPFLNRYCIECHSEERVEGDIRFDEFSWAISTPQQAQLWQDVLDVLNGGDMPPRKAMQPKGSAVTPILGSLTKTLKTAQEKMSDHGGVYTLRRLNQREYLRTAKHLFGINFDPSIVPQDYKIEQYDTIGEDQTFNYQDIDIYYDLGKKVVQSGFQWSAQSYPEPSEKKIQAEWISRKAKHNSYKQHPMSTKGHFLFFGDFNLVRAKLDIGKDPRAVYKIKIAAAANPETSPARHFMSLTDERDEIVHKITGTFEKPQVHEFTIPARLFRREGTRLYASESTPSLDPTQFRQHLKRMGMGNEFASIWIDWYSTTGPYYHQKSNFFGQLIKKYGKDESKAREFISEFAYEAFRRQRPSSSYVSGIVEFFQSRRKEMSYEKAMTETLALVLTSPNFLYLNEEQFEGSQAKLSKHSFAVRLAYFLWSSPPDETLYQLANSGQIFRTEILREQIERMLKDKRAEAFYEGFAGQWNNLDRFNSISIPKNEYPTFNHGLRTSAAREPLEFFKHIALNNLPIDNFIESDFITINAHLAHHYGLEGEFSNEFEVYKLPKSSHRGGLLGQAAFLINGSNGIKSSPVVRGAMILEKFFHSPPPPPPPNVPELGANVSKPMTNRELVQFHQTQEACSSCHSRIDPIGFGLENFDAIGRWRTHEKVGKKKVPIEQGGLLASGVAFKDAQELKALLLTQKNKLATALVEDLLEYGTGRTMVYSDRLQIAKIVEKAETNNYQFIDLLTDLISNKIFIGK